MAAMVVGRSVCCGEAPLAELLLAFWPWPITLKLAITRASTDNRKRLRMSFIDGFSFV
jgi:hypothetical protein